MIDVCHIMMKDLLSFQISNTQTKAKNWRIYLNFIRKWFLDDESNEHKFLSKIL